jgi:multicomponent Na+:H+ antiporter subunit B
VTRRVRLWLFAVAAAGLAVALGVGFAGLPHFGAPASTYADTLNALSVPQRRATDAVSAVSFDYRGIDTLFEEFILFVAVAGISILLRPLGDEIGQLSEDRAPDRRIPPPSPAVGLLGVLLSPLLLVAGLETVTHGQISPGGGFQGGVVVASAFFVVYLATSYSNVEHFEPGSLLEAADGTGAGGYVAVGILGLAGGSAYLTNVIGLGTRGTLSRVAPSRSSTRWSASKWPEASWCWPKSSFTRRRSSGAPHERPGLRGGRLADCGRPVRGGHEPQPHPPRRLPLRHAVGDRCAHLRDWVR